jgi:preprotein translocase subunit SecD
MRRGVLTRVIFFSVLTLIALVFLAPNFLGKKDAAGRTEMPNWWPGFLPSDAIHLGLDLQGGSHLVLEVKLDKAIENNMERLKNDLTNSLRDKGISGVSVERVEGTQLELKVPTANVERVRGILKAEFGNLSEAKTPQTGPTETDFFMALSREESRALRDYIVDQSLETIRNRIDQFGVSEPIIQRQGDNNILVQLPGIQDPQRAKDIIGKTALLEFKLVDDSVNPEEAVKNGPPPGRQVLYGQVGKGGAGAGAAKVPYVVESRTLMTGEYIQDAKVRPGQQLQGPYVELTLNDQGARLFEQITAANVKRRMAIVLDNNVYSAPVIQERIGGGRASITGSFDIKEARDLSIVLRAGALPAPVEIAEERTVGPSLGQDSIHQGVVSFAVGAGLVIVFMIAYYKGAGLIANVAVLFNILYMIAGLAGFQAVLTLPGIAGVVLTIGMAVDANVLINERIREELRAGRAVRSAIDAGYKNALPAIVDSNITTFLSGVILFQFGTGPIKGFAVTLCLGIATTILTAVYLTRIYYDYRTTGRKYDRVSI